MKSKLFALIISTLAIFISCKTNKMDILFNDSMTYASVLDDPVFNYSTGTYNNDILVTISCPVSGAIIHYTTDGSAPTSSSPVYSSAISVAGNGTNITIRAFAKKSGNYDSGIVTANYIISYFDVAPPTFDKTNSIGYCPGEVITLSSNTAGATIKYTTNGTSPGPSNGTVGTTVTINSSLTIRAYAYKAGMNDSTISSMAYTVYVIPNNVRYVDIDAPAGGNGTSWGTAYRDIQAAIDDAEAQSGTWQVWIAEGSYTIAKNLSRFDTVTMKSDVHIYGGFDGTECSTEQRDWNTHQTVFNGYMDNAACVDCMGNQWGVNNVVKADSITNAVLDGIVVIEGDFDDQVNCYGGGLYILNSSPEIRNCTFRDNFAENHGAGAAVVDGAPSFTNCLFQDNRADGSVLTTGGGLSVDNHADLGKIVTIDGCTFQGNRTGGYGGGLDLHDSRVIVTNSIIRSNTSTYRSAGIYVNSNAQVDIINCLIHDNNTTITGGSSGAGAGVAVYYQSTATIINSTITANNADVLSPYSDGIYVYYECTLNLYNSIVWGNDSIDIYGTSSSTINYKYSDTGTITGDTYNDLGNNKSSDPLFVNFGARDLRIQSTSQCRDSAESGTAPAQDILDNNRVGNPDMGAFEYQP